MLAGLAARLVPSRGISLARAAAQQGKSMSCLPLRIRCHALPAVAGGTAVGLSGAWLLSAPAACDGGGAPPHEVGEAAGPSLLQRCIAEAIGTGMIVAGGCGVVCAAKYAGHAVTPLGIDPSSPLWLRHCHRRRDPNPCFWSAYRFTIGDPHDQASPRAGLRV